MPDYIEVPLTRGKFAKIDIEDWPTVSLYSWRAVAHDRTFYAVATTSRGVGHRNFYMHRFLTNPERGVLVDHWNGDGLDNRRCNLRFSNAAQQMANQTRLHPAKLSRFKGVSFEQRTGKWRAAINYKRRQISLGHFFDEEAAAAAYDAAARRLYGEFACTNQHMNRSS